MLFQDEKLLTLSVSSSQPLVGAHGTLTSRVGLCAALLLCTGAGQGKYPDNPAFRWGTERAHGTVNPEQGTRWDWRDDEEAPLTILPLSLQYYWLLITIHPTGALRGPLGAAGYGMSLSQTYPLCSFVYTHLCRHHVPIQGLHSPISCPNGLAALRRQALLWPV